VRSAAMISMRRAISREASIATSFAKPVHIYHQRTAARTALKAGHAAG
jgi:hypothetical protein